MVRYNSAILATVNLVALTQAAVYEPVCKVVTEVVTGQAFWVPEAKPTWGQWPVDPSETTKDYPPHPTDGDWGHWDPTKPVDDDTTTWAHWDPVTSVEYETETATWGHWDPVTSADPTETWVEWVTATSADPAETWSAWDPSHPADETSAWGEWPAGETTTSRNGGYHPKSSTTTKEGEHGPWSTSTTTKERQPYSTSSSTTTKERQPYSSSSSTTTKVTSSTATRSSTTSRATTSSTTKKTTTSSTTKKTTTSTKAADPVATCPAYDGNTFKQIKTTGSSSGKCSYDVYCNAHAEQKGTFFEKVSGERVETLEACIAKCDDNKGCTAAIWTKWSTGNTASYENYHCWQVKGLGLPVTKGGSGGYGQIAYKGSCKGSESKNYSDSTGH